MSLDQCRLSRLIAFGHTKCAVRLPHRPPGLASELAGCHTEREALACVTCLSRSPGGCRRGDEAKLLEHQEPVEHKVERAMLAVAKAEHLDVVHAD
jgi:hypothetical protein